MKQSVLKDLIICITLFGFIDRFSVPDIDEDI
jgi:hypothetical protein